MRSGHRTFPRGQPGGFTLLELVVAMAMVAILAVSLYSSMQVAFRAQSSAEAATEPVRTADLAFDFIRQDLQDAIPPGGVLAGSFVATDQKDDRGRDGDDLQFFTTADAQDHPSGNGEIKNVDLTVEVPAGATQHCLVRKVIRNLLAEVQETPDEEIVCRGVGGFNLRYFDGSNWNDSYDSSQVNNVLPVAVEVTLTLDRPGASDPNRQFRFVRIIPLPTGVNQSEISS